MHTISVFFAYEDGELSLEELTIDGADILTETDDSEGFEEFMGFTLFDHLDFWDRLVERIKERIGEDDALRFDFCDLPDLSELTDCRRVTARKTRETIQRPDLRR